MKDISALKKEKNALILAHYYQTMDIQAAADYVCDSFEMARRAYEAKEQLLIICGVKFMAESAKILNPTKTVLLPAPDAGCPMADMITPENVLELKAKYPDAAVVCYVNSSCAVKAVSDVCCTSSSAEKIVRALPNDRIIFIPDQNLGQYVASRVPEKEIILYDGCCPTHHNIRERVAVAAKQKYPNAILLAHPECRPEVLTHAEYIGSTAGIIDFAKDSDRKEFIIGTELGVIDHLKALLPEKIFYPLSNNFTCINMKRTRLSDVIYSLEHGEFEIELDPQEREQAFASLERMVSLSRKN